MPVKVRCGGCGKVLTAPDRARGKAVRCPGCQQPIRVPAAAAKQAAARGVMDDEKFLQSFDVSRVEHKTERVCPKCAAELEAEDIECPQCGVNIETGVLSEEQRRIRERVGPDPALFYRKAWSNSWEFLKKNKRLAFRTAIYWTIFIWVAVIFAGLAYQAMQRTGVSVTGQTIEAGIWGMVAFLSLVSTFGWYWYLSVRITQATLERGTKLKDLHFDYGKFMALGVKAMVWPVVLMIPVMLIALPVLGAMVVLTALALDSSGLSMIGIAFGGLALFPYLAYPVAMSHMAMPYTYKAYLPIDMVVLFFRNIGPALYWWMMALLITAPIWGYLFLINYFAEQIIGFVVPALTNAALWCAGFIVNSRDTSSWAYAMFWYPFAALTGFVAIATVTVPAAFPAIFLARANGLFTYYRRETLDLVLHTKQGELAGFWIRYLAALIDFVILLSIFGVFWGICGLAWVLLIVRFGVTAMAPTLFGVTSILCCFAQYRYYVRSEIGNSQGTFGKSSLGLLVTDLDGNKITLTTARSRYFVRTFITPLVPFYLGYLMVCFTEKKQALHDALTKTKVVWEGDRER
ncbi:MAG: RDD family protein [Planctomycetaceae bacterium]